MYDFKFREAYDINTIESVGNEEDEKRKKVWLLLSYTTYFIVMGISPAATIRLLGFYDKKGSNNIYECN